MGLERSGCRGGSFGRNRTSQKTARKGERKGEKETRRTAQEGGQDQRRGRCELSCFPCMWVIIVGAWNNTDIVIIADTCYCMWVRFCGFGCLTLIETLTLTLALTLTLTNPICCCQIFRLLMRSSSSWHSKRKPNNEPKMHALTPERVRAAMYRCMENLPWIYMITSAVGVRAWCSSEESWPLMQQWSAFRIVDLWVKLFVTNKKFRASHTFLAGPKNKFGFFKLVNESLPLQ